MPHLGIIKNWTCNDMARVIVQALYNLDEPAKADNVHVVRIARNRKAGLIYRTEQAIECISQSRIAKLDAPADPIMDWTGYGEGAIKADAAGITRVATDPDGNLHVWMDGEVYNVHPKAVACGWGDDDRCEYAAGVYPIRWKL